MGIHVAHRFCGKIAADEINLDVPKKIIMETKMQILFPTNELWHEGEIPA